MLRIPVPRLPGARPWRLTAALGLTSAAAAVPWPAPAWADSPTASGWWTATNPGGLIVIPPPPDVPAHGLLVQGGTASSLGASDGGPLAFSAVVYTIPTGSVPETLTLKLAATAAPNPLTTLEACPLASSALAGVQNGPMGDAPAYSCRTFATAKLTGGTSYQFKVANLVKDGDLALAILPTSLLDRVVLAPPGTDSLALQDQSGADSPSTTGPAAGAGTGTGSSSATVPVGTPPTSGAGGPDQSGSLLAGADGPALTGGLDPAGTAPTTSPAPPAMAPTLSTAGSPARSALGAGAVNASFGTGRTPSHGTPPWAALLGAAALVVAGVGWVAAGRSSARTALEPDTEA